MPNELKGAPSEIHFTVTITRKATGAVETYNMVGTEQLIDGFYVPPVAPKVTSEPPKE